MKSHNIYAAKLKDSDVAHDDPVYSITGRES